jgi:hypothetical protein
MWYAIYLKIYVYKNIITFFFPMPFAKEMEMASP